MSAFPDWLPLVSVAATIAGAVFGGYVGVKVSVVKLQIKQEDMDKRLEALSKRAHRYNDDLLIHDMEIEGALAKLEIPRIRRQRLAE